jgi:CheY-like chemotaxis protein
MLAAQTWYEIVLPPVVTLLAITAGFGLLWLGRGRLQQLIGELGVQRVSAFGVDLQFAEQRTVAAYKKQGLGRPSQADRAAVRDAANFLAPLAAGARVLWVDDLPSNNEVERSTLISWQIDVQSERSTEDGIRELSDPDLRFDLVISDWSRNRENDGDPAGLVLMQKMSELELKPAPRVIFYHGRVLPKALADRRRRAREAGALGTTANPGELFRMILLELARIALDAPRPEQQERRGRLSTAADSGG